MPTEHAIAPWYVVIEITGHIEDYARGVADVIERELGVATQIECRPCAVWAVLVECDSKRTARYVERRIPDLFDRHEGLRPKLEAMA